MLVDSSQSAVYKSAEYVQHLRVEWWGADIVHSVQNCAKCTVCNVCKVLGAMASEQSAGRRNAGRSHPPLSALGTAH